MLVQLLAKLEPHEDPLLCGRLLQQEATISTYCIRHYFRGFGPVR